MSLNVVTNADSLFKNLGTSVHEEFVLIFFKSFTAVINNDWDISAFKLLSKAHDFLNI